MRDETTTAMPETRPPTCGCAPADHDDVLLRLDALEARVADLEGDLAIGSEPLRANELLARILYVLAPLEVSTIPEVATAMRAVRLIRQVAHTALPAREGT